MTTKPKRKLNRADFIVLSILGILFLVFTYLLIKPFDLEKGITLPIINKVIFSILAILNVSLATKRLENARWNKLSTLINKYAVLLLSTLSFLEVYRITTYFWGENWSLFLGFNFLLVALFFYCFYTTVLNCWYILLEK